ncbi:MAG: N-acetyltransferase [Myxococcales bacterium]|nr:N-acetyltransferase [Myxococcales bacterium]
MTGWAASTAIVCASSSPSATAICWAAPSTCRRTALYGRYWDCLGDDVANLHFEVCSYAGIETAIQRGWRRFEAGAGGGGHKYGRGFLPVITRSAHELLLPGLSEAVHRAVAFEREQLAEELASLEGHLLKE